MIELGGKRWIRYVAAVGPYVSSDMMIVYFRLSIEAEVSGKW